MPSAITLETFLQGSAWIQGTAGAGFTNAANLVVDGCFNQQSGTSFRSGAGVYPAQIRQSSSAGGAADGISASEHHALATGRTPASAICTAQYNVTPTGNATVLTVSVTGAGGAAYTTATDADVDVTIFRTRRVA
jgi:hypothetical protein